MFEKCTGVNLYNCLKQTTNITMEYQLITDKYNSNYDIPNIWLNSSNNHSKNIDLFLKRSSKNKRLIELIKQNDPKNNDEIKLLKNNNSDSLYIIKKTNDDYMKWRCIVKYNDEIYESIETSKHKGLESVMNVNRYSILN
jgi:hypothetical protein